MTVVTRDWYCQFISASRIDEFVQFNTGLDFKGSEYPLESYIDKLLKIESPKSRHKMDGGTAGHNVLELAIYDSIIESSLVKVDGKLWKVVFDKISQEVTEELSYEVHNAFGDTNLCIEKKVIESDIEIQLPIIRESWVRGTFAGVDIRGKVDAIDAIDVHDHKFTSQVDIDKYMSSAQWKLYLLMTGRNRFIYNLFTVKVDDNDNLITVKDYQKLELCSYDGMANEMETIIAEYKEFLITIKSLLESRINEYNALIDNEIALLSESGLITVKDELITILNNSKLKGLEE